jgi:hypothetical protein
MFYEGWIPELEERHFKNFLHEQEVCGEEWYVDFKTVKERIYEEADVFKNRPVVQMPSEQFAYKYNQNSCKPGFIGLTNSWNDGFGWLLVERRTASVNAALRNGKLKIDARCKTQIRDLESLAYKPGSPVFDLRDPQLMHISDALGYCVYTQNRFKPAIRSCRKTIEFT